MENKEVEYNINHYATMDNGLIKYQRTLSTSALKLLRIIISQIDTSRDNILLTYTIGFSELAELLGISKHKLYEKDKDQQYKNVRNIAKQLQMTVASEHQNNKELILLTWCPTIRINNEDKTLTVKLNEDLKPYLIDLKNRFTSVQLKYIMGFKCKYTLRLYEILLSLYNENNRQKFYFTFTVEEIRSYLDCIDNYKSFKDFRRYVLQPAIDEIQHTINGNGICGLHEIKIKGRTAKEITIFFDEMNMV